MAGRGEKYKINVPDTIDLAERAVLALNGLAGVLDPKANYEHWFSVIYYEHPPYMVHDNRSFSCCGPKLLESFPLMRIMSGSEAFNKEEEGLKKLLISWIDDDGLQYTRIGPDRPWDNVCQEDYANVYGQARMMLAMMAYYQFDGDPVWYKRIDKMADGLIRIAIDKGDYAYYPANMGNEKVRIGEGYCYPKSGWYSTQEASSEKEGVEGSMFAYHSGPIRALSRWYRMSGNEKAIHLAKKLVNYATKAQFWGSEYGWPKTIDRSPGHSPLVQAYKIVGSERAQFEGHFHGHTAMLYALIEYANTVNDKYLKEFVRSGYEYARNFGISRAGLFGETCSISDMIAIAIKLSGGGVGDYWDDVDSYIRNQMIEQQLVNPDFLRKVAEKGSLHQITPPYESADNVIERSIGVFCDAADLAQIPNLRSCQCCTGNGTQGLYYAWEAIIREKQHNVQVNLLLNRSSPWMDIDSCLPYEGKIVLKNKTAQKLFLRIPNWVNRLKVRCTINGKPQKFWLVENHAILEGLKPRDRVVFTFPMEEEKVTFTVLSKQQWSSDPREDKNPPGTSVKFVCHFKGNTLVDISPSPDGRWYPIYQRDRYKDNKAPMEKVVRYVSPIIIGW